MSKTTTYTASGKFPSRLNRVLVKLVQNPHAMTRTELGYAGVRTESRGGRLGLRKCRANAEVTAKNYAIAFGRAMNVNPRHDTCFEAAPGVFVSCDCDDVWGRQRIASSDSRGIYGPQATR